MTESLLSLLEGLVLAPWERPIGLLQLETKPAYFVILLSAAKLLDGVILLPKPTFFPTCLKPKRIGLSIPSPQYSDLLELNKVANNFDSAP